jgi:single-stranded DNA-specific DHH superfamily exonuclease
VWIDAYPIIHYGTSGSSKTVTTKITINCIIPKNETTSEHIETIRIFDPNSADVKRLRAQYLEYDSKRLDFIGRYNTAEANVESVQNQYDALEENIDKLKEYKKLLNIEFFKKYSRFI